MDLSSELATAPDGTWYVDSGGAGLRPGAPVVVLLHGVGLDLHMWDGQAAALAERARVVRFDMLGHGRTPPRPGPLALRHYCEQVTGVLDHLGLESVVLVGFSMGGVIAQRFSADAPGRVRALLLMSTVYRRTVAELAGVRERLELTLSGGPQAIAQRAVDRWFPESFQREHAEEVASIRARLESNHPGGYAEAYRIFVECEAEVGEALRHVDCPALVLTGEEDVGSTPAIGQRMVDDLAHGRLRVLPGLRHMVMVQCPDWVNAALLEFLDEIEAGWST